MRLRFTAIITTHQHDIGHIMGVLARQTQSPDEVIVMYSDLPEISFCGNLPFPVKFARVQPNRNDWGHEKRDLALEMGLGGDYLGFFNADDWYDPTYIEKMMEAAERTKAGFVYCAWNISPCEPKNDSSTSGNFIVLYEIAWRVGWKGRHYEADGQFINEVVAECNDRNPITYVPERLYRHNALHGF